MTSQGTASGRFTRAVQRGHLFAAEMAAREMGPMSLSNALSLCILYRREQDPKFDRAAVRWVRRVQARTLAPAAGGRPVACSDGSARFAVRRSCAHCAVGAVSGTATSCSAYRGCEWLRCYPALL